MNVSMRARAVGLVALVLMMVSGCDGEEDPASVPVTLSSDPPSSAAASTTAEAAPTEAAPTEPVEPTLPAPARAFSEAGVESFVTHYWHVLNYATKSGDTRQLESLDQPSCEGCAAAIRGITSVYQRGGRVIGGDYEIVHLDPARSDRSHWAVVAHTRLHTQRTVNAGSLNGTFQGGRARWLVAVARIHHQWSVTTLELLQ